uniref:Uncharacterized protein n=1 Tax=Gossypium raimondii TaxID=29730 RepID=A0A0D2TZD2_GOSRA|nr:hypothetical protein B456_008G081000 [Gossypium raimondii]
MQMLTTKFKNLRLQSLQTISQFYAKLCDLSNQSFALVEEYFNSKLVRKVLRSLLKRFDIKVIAIKEAKYLDSLWIDELIGSL